MNYNKVIKDLKERNNKLQEHGFDIEIDNWDKEIIGAISDKK